MPDAYANGGFALTVPAAASSIGVNLSDPAGGAAGKGTYVLMTFRRASTLAAPMRASFLPPRCRVPTVSTASRRLRTTWLTTPTRFRRVQPGIATRMIMTITGGPNALLWKGAASGNWDTSAGNFDNLGTSETGVAFANNDNVTFDDTGSNTNPIMVAGGGVQPNIVTINNTTGHCLHVLWRRY